MGWFYLIVFRYDNIFYRNCWGPARPPVLMGGTKKNSVYNESSPLQATGYQPRGMKINYSLKFVRL